MNSFSVESLEFLDHLFAEPGAGGLQKYQQAPWLICDFNARKWICDFGSSGTIELDWALQLGSSGESLLGPRHATLLTTLRAWLALSTHPDAARGRLWALDTQFTRFSAVVDYIDYLLLHADELCLATHGLATITRDDLVSSLARIGSSASKSVGVYEWPDRLSTFLRTNSAGLCASEVSALTAELPFLAENVPAAEERLTNLTTEEIVRCRAFLWISGLYRKALRRRSFRWVIHTKELAAQVYPNTLRGSRGKPMPPELGLIPSEPSHREYPSAPVAGDSDVRMSRLRLKEYYRAMSILGILDAVSLQVPLLALRGVHERDLDGVLSVKPGGRYKTLPADVVFYAMRAAIEFLFKHAKGLSDSYLALAQAAKEAGLTIGRYARAHGIEQHLDPSMRALGVSRWTLEEQDAGLPNHPTTLAKDEYFRRLRENVGLWELIRVMYGATQIVVGTLSARRVGELVDLIAGRCLDNTDGYLVFENRKSGVAGQRSTEARPIPKVAARFIRQLEALQQGLLSAGLIDELTNVFAYPKGQGKATLVELPTVHYCSSLDYFCDYVELPLDDFGRRFYVRQHQLRRFFAMLFFWTHSFGGLDTLRYFLGHTNPEHVYRYVTESVPGYVLRSVKAEWATEAVKVQWAAAEKLSDLIELHFSTRDFQLLTDEELSEYIEELIEQGTVSIEPEFLDRKGAYRILIKVSEDGGLQ